MHKRRTSMRLLVPAFLLSALTTAAVAQVSVGGPTQTPDPAYPLRVRILTRNASRGPAGMRMWGRADLFSPQEEGIDYESTCDEVVMVTHGEERYSARWKKPNKELEMLLSRVGTGKANKCVVKVDVQQFVYEFQNGTSGPVATKPLAK